MMRPEESTRNKCKLGGVTKLYERVQSGCEQLQDINNTNNKENYIVNTIIV